MYAECWPASLGHSGLLLLPPGPWQAPQTAALPAPAWASPPVNGSGLASCAKATGATDSTATSTKCFMKDSARIAKSYTTTSPGARTEPLRPRALPDLSRPAVAAAAARPARAGFRRPLERRQVQRAQRAVRPQAA